MKLQTISVLLQFFPSSYGCIQLENVAHVKLPYLFVAYILKATILSNSFQVKSIKLLQNILFIFKNKISNESPYKENLIRRPSPTCSLPVALYILKKHLIQSMNFPDYTRTEIWTGMNVPYAAKCHLGRFWTEIHVHNLIFVGFLLIFV